MATQASPPRRVPGQYEVELAARGLAPEQVVGLIDAWTQGLEVELSPSRQPADLTVRRSEAARAHVYLRAVADGASELRASLPVSVGKVQGAVEPGHQLLPFWRRRPGVGLAATLAVIVASTLVASSSGRQPTQSSAAASPPPSPLAPTVDTVPLPSGSAISADPATGGFLLVGCCDPPRPGLPTPVSTWEWDGSSWNHDHPATVPPYTRNMVLGFDGIADAFVLHTGDDPPTTWTWNPSARGWQLEPDAVQPPAGPASVVAEPSTEVEPISRLLVATGGQFGNDLQAWSRIAGGWRLDGAVGVSAPALFGDIGVPMAEDEVHGKVVLVLESGAESTAPTYLYDGQVWSEAATGGLPYDPNTQLTWDSSLQRVLAIVPGDSGVVGRGAVGTTGTWAWDGTTWTRLAD